ncbi:enolase C-terminal domain-like protein [Lacibacter sp.]|uniref:enolase C-terminal domain-like protein n=1 Tax=Lacibacter sp. TaxID=1915409 RepID=UPI002B4B6A20|nr:enolase C-terminal domain-like protein [Lacibacter sp.]HLP37691.1 enolase C-terminal domain-like protein [Lacibacter sp.]
MKRRSFIKNVTVIGGGVMLLDPFSLHAEKNLKHPSYAELEHHVVEKVETVQFSYRWPRLVGRNSMRDVHGQHHKNFALKIYTDKGAMGWGLAGPERLKEDPGIIGKKVSELISPATGIHTGVSRKYDIALYDLCGVILQQPVYKLLGAKGTLQTPLYSGMIYLDELPADNHAGGMDMVFKNCEWDFNYGYRALKIKIGRSGKWYAHDEGLQKDIDVVNSIWSQYKNKNVQLLVDANDAYSMQDVQTFLKGIADVPLYWLEEPFTENIEQARVLKQWMNKNGFQKTYYADGEANPLHDVCMTLLKEKTLDVMLTDTMGYGFSNWIGLLKELKAGGALASPHAWGDKLKTNYTAHLAAGIGGVCTVEGVTCLSDDIDYGNYQLINGNIKVSDAPGFGMKLLKH